MGFKQIPKNEAEALAYLNSSTPLNEVAILVRQYQSCALKAVKNSPSNSSVYLVAVECSEVAANYIFKQAVAQNLLYALVKCAHHKRLAEQLIGHHSPIVRASCTRHHDLAIKLKNDSNEYVRNACCQWLDILETIENDPSKIVRNRQIISSPTMAMKYLLNGNLQDQELAIRSWINCAKYALASSDPQLNLLSQKVFSALVTGNPKLDVKATT